MKSVSTNVRTMNFLGKMRGNAQAAEALSNKELAHKLLHKVWSGMDMSSVESCLVDEAIKRLKAQGE